MSFSKLTTLVAALAATFALSTVAYGDPGKSPNGPPGPAGNPNQEQAQPQSQAAPPESPGKSDESHGQSDESHGNSDQAQAKSHPAPKAKKHSGQQHANHANPNPGTPRKGGREDRPSPKVTICHATSSETNPYVEITISQNGWDNGHSKHGDDLNPVPSGGCPGGASHENAHENGHDNGKVTICHATGSETNPYVEITIAQAGWDNGHSKHEDDLNPVPEGGCPGTAPQTTGAQGVVEQPNPFVAPQPEVSVVAPATTEAAAPATTTEGQAVLGARAEGGSSAPDEGGNEVLGAEASGGSAPASAVAPAAAEATKKADTGSLPFTGFELALVLLLAAGALMAGFALKRASGLDG